MSEERAELEIMVTVEAGPFWKVTASKPGYSDESIWIRHFERHEMFVLCGQDFKPIVDEHGRLSSYASLSAAQSDAAEIVSCAIRGATFGRVRDV